MSVVQTTRRVCDRCRCWEETDEKLMGAGDLDWQSFRYDARGIDKAGPHTNAVVLLCGDCWESLQALLPRARPGDRGTEDGRSLEDYR